jgi:hypothetical protein
VRSFLKKVLSGFLSDDKNYDFVIKFTKLSLREPFRLSTVELPKWSTLIPYKNWVYVLSNIKGSSEITGFIDEIKNICLVDMLPKGLSEELLTDVVRSYFHYYLERKGGIFIHASGISIDSKGFIFSGPAQAGKSTIVALLKGERIVSDECIMIAKNKSSYYIHSTPFYWRDKSNNESSKLKGIFFLRKAKKLRIKNLSVSEGVSNLFSNLWLSAQDKRTAEISLGNIMKILQAVPCYRLDFALNSSFHPLIKRLS